jgi:hypothetical protein
MDRRSVCRALALLPFGVLLAACDHPRAAAVALDPAAGPAVAGKETPQLLAALLAADWALDTPAGLTAGYSIRDRDPAGVPAVTVAFRRSYNSSHRVSYAVFDGAGEASRAYAAEAAALRDDPRGPATAHPDAPYPATTRFDDERGRGAILVGPVLVRVLATGSNRRLFDALVAASVAHLARALAGG